MNIGIVAFTAHGHALLEKIQEVWPEHFFDEFNKNEGSIKDWVGRVFATCDAVFFIGATGIAVRLIAPLLKAKDQDPAVLVIDEKGRFVIPLVSGHIGGANRLALDLAVSIGAEPVITTATDLNGVFAVDEWSTLCGCVIADISRIKHVSAALLAGNNVGFYSDFPIVGSLPFGLIEDLDNTVGICVSLDAHKSPFTLTLNVIPKIVILGAGCKKATDGIAFESFVLEKLQGHNVSHKALQKLTSIDLKKDESCFATFAHTYALEFITFSAEELGYVQGEFTSSAFVKKITGVDNVCERSAMAGGGGSLLVHKINKNGMTMALAIPRWVCRF